jgi:hypothetical protein
MTATVRRILMKRKIITNHTNDVRDSCWTLIQNDDGALHVEQEVEYRDGQRRKRVVPINDFMRENGPPPRALQSLVDRMFNDG